MRGRPWRVLPRDADRGRIERGHVTYPYDPAKPRLASGQVLIARMPGAITLAATAPGGRRAYAQFAVGREADGQRYVDLPFGDALAPAFPRPVVVRDHATWSRTFLDWWGESDLDAAHPPPPALGSIAFPHRNVLIVNLETPFGRLGHQPTVTHIADGVVHVAVPEGDVAPERPPLAPPSFVSPASIKPLNAWVFDLPALPAGVRVEMASFPESTRPRWAPDVAAD